MNFCDECEKSSIRCACSGVSVCESHCLDHLGSSHHMYDCEKAQKSFLDGKNRKKLEKMREKIEGLERNIRNCKENGDVYIVKNGFYGRRKFERLENLQIVENGMPVIVDGKVGICELNSGKVKTTNYEVDDNVGFTLNIFGDLLLIVCGMKDFVLSDKIINVFNSELLCTVKVPRIFHSSIIHKSDMYLTGGESLCSDYSTIEKINLLSRISTTLIPLKSRIPSPLSLLNSKSQIITRFTIDQSEENEYKILVFDTNTDSCYFQSPDHNQTFQQFERFDSFYNENWTPSQIVSVDGTKKFLYLNAKNIIVNTLAPMSDVININ